MAFLLAFAAWFAVGSEERTETSLQMLLELTNVPNHLMVTNETPAQIEVRVQGPRSVIRELSTEKLHKQIDLSHVKPGTYTELLTPGSLNFPRGVIVTRIRPSALSIELDQALVRRVEVQPVIKGSPAPGFEVAEVVLTPKTALLRGPKRDMENIKFINTIPIDINKLSSSLTKDVELDFQNLPLTYLENQPLVAKIAIRPKLQTKTFANLMVVPFGTTSPLRLDPPQVSITVRGPVTNLGLTRPEDITPRLNLKNLKAGFYEAKVAADLPDGLELVGIAPEKVKVRIMK